MHVSKTSHPPSKDVSGNSDFGGLKIVSRVITMCLSALLLASCASYSVAGYFEDSRQLFRGNVLVSLTDAGTIDVVTEDGMVTCKGTSQVTKRPSGFTTVGARGSATAKCSDGRSFKADFLQTTESGGQGRGIDDQGRVVKLYFSTSADVAESLTREEMLRSLMR